MLVPDGARAATSRISRIIASSTASGRKARTERRDSSAWAAIAVCSGGTAVLLLRDSIGALPNRQPPCRARQGRHGLHHRRPCRKQFLVPGRNRLVFFPRP